MSLTQIAAPYPIFTDTDGTPLDDGYLYIGEVSKNPETNPIAVYWDPDFKFPAAQPIRTNNGYPWRMGTPALLYADSQFSITVRNKKRDLVLYAPVGFGVNPSAVAGSVVKDDYVGDGATTQYTISASPATELATNAFINGAYQEKDTYSIAANVLTFSEAPPLNASIEIITMQSGVLGATSANLVSYQPAGAGSTKSDVQTKLREVVSVKDFGAVGDGTTNDHSAIQAALNSGARCIHIPSGYYKVGSTLQVPATVSLIYGDGVNASRIWSATCSSAYLLDTSLASVSLRDFRIYGGDQETTPFSVPTARNGILANGVGNQFAWERLAIYGFDVGATVGALASTVYMCMFNHVDVAACNTGIHVDQGMHQSSWLNCQFRACVNYGLKFDPTGSTYEIVANGIYNCTFERISGSGTALYLNNVRGIDVSACYFEGNKGNSIYLTGTSSNGADGVSIHDCYFFEYAAFHTPSAGGHGVHVVGPYVSGVSLSNNHFEDYNTATFYAIRLVGYSGATVDLLNNTFNNCANDVQTDYGYNLNDYGSINNAVVARKQGRTDGSGNLAGFALGKISLGNNTATLFLQVTAVQCTDDIIAVDSTSVFRMKASVSGGNVVVTTGAGVPTGWTFGLNTTELIGSSYVADLRLAVAGGNLNTNVGIIVEVAYENNGKFSGISTIESAYS